MVEQETFNFEVPSSTLGAITKVCNKCGNEKLREDFHKHAGKKDGLQPYCKACASIVNKDTYARLPRRKEKILERNGIQRKKDTEFINRYKRYCGCRICSERTPVALDFHHLDAEDKELEVSNLIGWSRAKIKKEIRKCVVLCANCHRKHHAGVQGYEL